MQRFEGAYQVKRGDNLGDASYWNKRLQDLDLRLHARELDADALKKATDDFQSLALSRINDTLVPVVQQAIEQLSEVGAVLAANSETDLTIGVGFFSLVLTEDTRASYVITDYVTISYLHDSSKGMLARVVSYDRPSGLMDVEAVSYSGEGTFSEWVMRIATAPVSIDAYSRSETDALLAGLSLTVADGDKGDITVSDAGDAWAINDGAVTAEKMATDSVDTDVVVDAAVTGPKLADGAVTGTKVQDSALTYAKMAAAAVIAAGEYAAATASKLLSAAGVWADATFKALTDATNIAVNMATGINFSVTLAGNRTLSNPTNGKPGQSGVIKVTATGATRTLSIGGYWFPATGVESFPLSITTSETVYVAYHVESANVIWILSVFRR